MAVRREVVMARRHKLVFVAAVVLVVQSDGGRARTRTEASELTEGQAARRKAPPAHERTKLIG